MRETIAVIVTFLLCAGCVAPEEKNIFLEIRPGMHREMAIAAIEAYGGKVLRTGPRGFDAQVATSGPQANGTFSVRDDALRLIILEFYNRKSSQETMTSEWCEANFQWLSTEMEAAFGTPTIVTSPENARSKAIEWKLPENYSSAALVSRDGECLGLIAVQFNGTKETFQSSFP
ncbi:MAG: hypothetical protein WD034_03970 [Parvibaculum sp.]